MSKRLFSAFLLLMTLTQLAAQSEYAVTVDFDKKTICVDSLGLLPNTPVQTILHLLPELLERPSETIITNYDVKVEGMTLGDASDAALSQLHLADIEKIEISESAIASYQHNGQGGSINILLRSSSTENKSVWGSASMTRLYETDLTPQFQVGMKSDKLLVRALVLAELYNVDAENFWSQMENVYMCYNPTERDELQLKASNSKSNDAFTNGNSYIDEIVSDFRINMNYKHVFRNKSEFSAEMQYNYHPKLNFSMDSLSALNQSRYTNSFGGNMQYKYWVIPESEKRMANLSAGINLYKEHLHHNIDQQHALWMNASYIDSDGSQFFMMPYLSFESSFGPFRLKMVGEFQRVMYDVNIEGHQTEKVKRNDFTGKIMAGWQFGKSRFLRMTLDRKLQRPSYEQVYPIPIYYPEYGYYLVGNNELNPYVSNEIGVDYISDIKWGVHNTIFNIGVTYIRINDIINSRMIGVNDMPDDISEQTLTVYRYYYNYGNNDILNLNMMMLYRYRRFSLSLTGNMYYNRINSDFKDKYMYYNISAVPVVNLNNGWDVSGSMVYHGKVRSQITPLPDCSYVTFVVGKKWGRFYANIEAKLFLDGKGEYNNTGGFGIMYKL